MNAVRSTPSTSLLLTCLHFSLILVLFNHALADEPNRMSLEDIEFELQPGLTLERAVPKSLVKWPVLVDWDSDGRLVVVEAGGASKPTGLLTSLYPTAVTHCNGQQLNWMSNFTQRPTT